MLSKRRLSSPSRNRWFYAGSVAIVIVAGLFLRSRFCPLPKSFTKMGGDALWALVVFLGIGFVFPRISSGRLALVAFFFSAVVEFSQLYHAPWLDAIRQTRLGFLVLGSTFHAPDLLAYAAGIGIGALVELALGRRA